jgi:hypothetical protein
MIVLNEDEIKQIISSAILDAQAKRDERIAKEKLDRAMERIQWEWDFMKFRNKNPSIMVQA